MCIIENVTARNITNIKEYQQMRIQAISRKAFAANTEIVLVVTYCKKIVQLQRIIEEVLCEHMHGETYRKLLVELRNY